MSDKTFRVAFIGAGTIVQRAHIPGFKALPNVEPVAICDVNAERVAAVAAEHGIPAGYTDYEVMLREVKPDITVIATPNVFHKPMTLAALNAGSNVLCEKPLALTYEDAKEMLETAAAKGLILNVGTHYRYTPTTRAAKAHVDGGFLGEVYAARAVWQRRSGIPGFGGWFTNKGLAGGGALLDIGIHALDRALYLMGYPKPVSVSGASFAKFGPRGVGLGGWGNETVEPIANAKFDVDDLAWAFIRFENGAVMQFQVSWAANMPEESCAQLFGTDGGMLVTNNDLKLYKLMNGQEVNIDAVVPGGYPSSYGYLMEQFIKRLNGDDSAPIMTPEQALIAVQIVDGVMRSAASGQEVRFD
jgi:predicted dehydrogenase